MEYKLTTNINQKCSTKIIFMLEESDLKKKLNKLQLTYPEQILKDFKGSEKEINSFYSLKEQVILLGLGKEEDMTIEKLNKIIETFTDYYSKLKKKTNCLIYLENSNLNNKRDELDFIKDQIHLITLYTYKFAKYKNKDDNNEIKQKKIVSSNKSKKSPKKSKNNSKKTKKQTKDNIVNLTIYCEEDNLLELKNFLKMVDSMKLVRDLGNEPSNILNPDEYVRRIKLRGKQSNFQVIVHNEKKIKKLGMNSLLSVSAGSKYPGYLIELRLKKVRKEKPMALVGKGITFDSGGISLKRPHKMGAMKTDMLGSATVLGIIDYLAQIKCRRNVIGFMAIAENMPGPNATRPGDIVKSYSGKTIEILDTDAEGRLVLADALAYAEKTHKPRTIIDFATLTGQQDSVSCALFASLMGTDETLNKELLEMSEKTNEKLVEFPLYQEYIDHTKSDIADVKNYEFGCNSGMIHAGAFLSNFIDRKKVKWAHLDIAGPARMEGMPSAYGVRLVSEYILQ